MIKYKSLSVQDEAAEFASDNDESPFEMGNEFSNQDDPNGDQMSEIRESSPPDYLGYFVQKETAQRK